MKKLLYKAAYTNGQWIENALFTLDHDGTIQSISSLPSFQHQGADVFDGLAVPSFVNSHSHAFQYAMIGETENLPVGAKGDNFWSWRERMYDLALQTSPDSLYAIALRLYRALLQCGFGTVVEFHYLHHAPDGTPYRNPAAMGEALIQAAKDSGIDICLVPIFYQKGGFGIDASRRQVRFLSPTFEDYLKLHEATTALGSLYAGASFGMGIHSLRAVSLGDVQRVCSYLPSDCVLHIHIAEQTKEVEDCVNYTGLRPVQWLLENTDVDSRFQLVHATHIDQSEVAGIAKREAAVVICPSTEANLGDGIFPLSDYSDAGGHWSIGTDSHIGLCPLEELRLLEYGQRLTHRKRNILCRQDGDESGTLLYEHSRKGGCFAQGSPQYQLRVGDPMKATIFHQHIYPLKERKAEQRWSTLIFSGHRSWIQGVQNRNRWIPADVKNIK